MKKSTAVAGLLYGADVAVLHGSVVLNPGSRILAGSQVGALFIWEFWWVKKALATAGLNPLYSTFLMFPRGVPVLPQSPLLLVLSLALQMGMSVYAAYNLLTLLAYAGAGFSMYLLAERVTGREDTAFFSGYVFMFSHYALTQHVLGHLNQAFLCFVPLVFLALLQMAQEVSRKSSLLFFMSALGTSLTSTYLLLEILIVGVPIFLLALLGTKRIKSPRVFLKNVVALLSLVGMIDAVFFWPIVSQASTLIGGSESASLSVLSFFDFPAWHPEEWVQRARWHTSGFIDADLVRSAGFMGRAGFALLAKPENLMGFFGLSVCGLVLYGALTRTFTLRNPWTILALAGLILSLGPRLQWAYGGTGIPLPYLLIERLPLFSLFRAPARMILLTWLGASLLAGVSLTKFLETVRSKAARAGAVAFFVGLYSWEMAVPGAARVVTPIRRDAVTDALARDPSSAALLELPAAILPTTDISINVQHYMLLQPIHDKPLVVGRASRHTRFSLSFCDSVDYVYELTHPATLAKLYDNAVLEGRREDLIKRGGAILRGNGIRYVVFHKDETSFDENILRIYERFLRESLGAPMESTDNALLWKVY